jgi:hypothetical protein
MLNSDELLSLYGQVKEIGKRTGLLFRELTNIQRVSAANALTVQEQPSPKDQSVIEIMEDTESVIKSSTLKLFWRLCTLRVPHWEKEYINGEYKDTISTLIAFKVKGEDLQIAGCSLYSISDGRDKQGNAYLLPIKIANMVEKKKVAEIDFLYTVSDNSDWKNLLLQTIVRCITTKSGLSNGTEMILCSPVTTFTLKERNTLVDMGFQELGSADVYVLQDLHDLHLMQATPSSLRSVKALKYCPADEASIFGPCE